MVKFYLSYGAGVGSEALRLYLLENGYEFEAVYVDHGCDWPETQEFVKTIKNLTILKPKVLGYNNVYEYCLHYKIVPSIQYRWCTYRFKIEVMYKYFKRPCIVYQGITFDEAHRIKSGRELQIVNHYPFVCIKMTRADCVEYIKRTSKKVPSRSNCWFCPFQSKERWRELMYKHPDLFEKAKKMEKLNIIYRKSQEKKILTLSGYRFFLSDFERQLPLFNIIDK